MWWNGPKWLAQDDDKWKVSALRDKQSDLPEIKYVRLALITVQPPHDLIQVFSNWSKLIRIVAWLKIFVHFIKKGRASIVLMRYLTVSDLKTAEVTLLKRAQKDEFLEQKFTHYLMERRYLNAVS